MARPNTTPARPAYPGRCVSGSSAPDWTRLLIADATLYDPNSLIDSSTETSAETSITLTSAGAHKLDTLGFSGAQYYLAVSGLSWSDALILETLLHITTDPGIASEVEAGIVCADNAGATALHWAGSAIRWSSGYTTNLSLAGGYSTVDVSTTLGATIDRSRCAVLPTYLASDLRPRIAAVGADGYHMTSGKPTARKTHAVVNPVASGIMTDGQPVYAILTIGANAALTAKTIGLRAWYRAYEPTTGHDV